MASATSHLDRDPWIEDLNATSSLSYQSCFLLFSRVEPILALFLDLNSPNLVSVIRFFPMKVLVSYMLRPTQNPDIPEKLQSLGNSRGSSYAMRSINNPERKAAGMTKRERFPALKKKGRLKQGLPRIPKSARLLADTLKERRDFKQENLNLKRNSSTVKERKHSLHYLANLMMDICLESLLRWRSNGIQKELTGEPYEVGNSQEELYDDGLFCEKVGERRKNLLISD
ncbi:hypothetical protein L1987_74226 [Smallanthus sonchifolius]|uniref:Uncharacterized protein n=1 Tax=Smallanthus sonchifolius TaxID=185202 RepID=A0ACB9A388_9ASTR|nr:hypothetical protein L1987_74226 [Smallanthus sonchifolius]